MKQPKLGSGKRFEALKNKAAAEYAKKGKSPEASKKIGAAIAAKAGMDKFGKKKMLGMAIAAKKKKK